MKLYPLVFLLFLSISVHGQELVTQTTCSDQYISKELTKNTEVFRVSEQPPYFGYCDEFIPKKLNTYRCSDENIKVFLIEHGIIDPDTDFSEELKIQFIVEKGGCLNQIQIVTNTTSFSESKILDTIKKMDDWQPGTQNGKVVRVLREIDVKVIAGIR